MFGFQNILTELTSDPQMLMNAIAPMRAARPADLGPNQIAWCRANIQHFSKLKDMADNARLHARNVAAELRAQNY